jgi:hypothetical protein
VPILLPSICLILAAQLGNDREAEHHNLRCGPSRHGGHTRLGVVVTAVLERLFVRAAGGLDST